MNSRAINPMTAPNTFDTADLLDSAADSMPRPAQRRTLPLAMLAPAFALLNDRTGRAAGPETMSIYGEHFGDLHLSVEAVYEAVREIILGWEKPYWPTAEHIGIVAQRKQRAVSGEAAGMGNRARELQDASMGSAQPEWDDRVARGEAWFDAHPAIAKLIVAGINADIEHMVRAQPNGRMATQPKYQRAFRHGAIVGACLRHLTYGNSATTRREIRELGVRFPALAVDPHAAYQAPDAEPIQAAEAA